MAVTLEDIKNLRTKTGAGMSDCKKAIDDNFSFYSPVPGYMPLRKAIVEKLKNENGLEFDPSQIVCSNGAKQAVCNAILSLTLYMLILPGRIQFCL